MSADELPAANRSEGGLTSPVQASTIDRETTWALLELASTFPSLITTRVDLPSHLTSLAGSVPLRLRIADALALANTFGGYLIFGGGPIGFPKPLRVGVRPSQIEGFVPLFRATLERLGLPTGAISFHTVEGICHQPFLVVKVEKLKIPLPVVADGVPQVIQFRETGLVFAPLDGAHPETFAMSHDEAAHLRGKLRAAVAKLRPTAPPPYVPLPPKPLKSSAKPKAAAPAPKPTAKLVGPPMQRPVPADASESADIGVRMLTWEVLPAATLEGRWMGAFREENPYATRPEIREHLARLEFLKRLLPNQWFEGRRLGERVYFVLLFDSVAIADSPQYGNALYYYHGADWRAVFSLTKQEARREGARRLVHTGDWEERVVQLVRASNVRLL